MKKILNPHSSNTAKDFMLLLLRVVVGYLLISQHGFGKFQKLLSDEPIRFFSFLGMSPETTIILPMIAEFICALFVIFGFFTRIASAIVAINMAFIVFYIHGSDPISSRELPMIYLVSYIFIFFAGPGKHSIDNLLHKRYVNKTATT